MRVDEKQAVGILKAVSDMTRLRIISFLLNGERCVCEIIPHVKRKQSTVSIHLNALKRLGILRSRRDGKKVYYSISDPRVRSILRALGFQKNGL